TIAILGSALEALRDVRGDVGTRSESLHKGHTDLVDSTIYELLVAAASVRRGRSVELLEASKNQKSPDIRLHDMGVPFVIECKRRTALFAYEQEEEARARLLFHAAYSESTKA